MSSLILVGMITLGFENRTYKVDFVSPEFTVNETVSRIGYSLNKQANVTIAGNTTLTSSANGPHNTIVYANDTVGNMGSSNRIYLTVEPDVVLTVETSKPSYEIGEIINFYGKLTYNSDPLASRLITIMVYDPQNQLVLIRTVMTNETGMYYTSINSASITVTGTYTAIAKTYVCDVIYTNSTIFEVKPAQNVNGALPFNASAVYPINPWWYVDINVSVENQGTETENFTVTVHYDEQTIAAQNVTNLTVNESRTLTFTWNLSDTEPCTFNYSTGCYVPYTITINISSSILGEMNVIYGNVTVRRVGDANGDGHCGGADFTLLAMSWWREYPDPYYDWRCDFNGDGRVNSEDLTWLGMFWYEY